MAVSNLLNIGNHALLANQTAINVVGTNIANVDVAGYSKQTSVFLNFTPYSTTIGTAGSGAYISEITRSFDQILENQFLGQFSTAGKYATQAGVLSSVESLFNESNRDGINSTLSEFFNNWQELANWPDDEAIRVALLANAETLTGIINDTYNALEAYQQQLNDYIAQDVATVNSLIESIAMVTQTIGQNNVPGYNLNALYDERDELVRQLSAIIDVEVEDNGGMDYIVRMTNGMSLVEGNNTFSIELKNGVIEYNCTGFTGEAIVSGEDDFEYHLEITNDGMIRVSLDGGKTWLKDDDGSELHFEIPEVGESIKIKDIEISFTADDFAPGDVINITPKTGLYWNSPTRTPVNITPLELASGSYDDLRATGGTLSAYFIVRDYDIGTYIDKLDAFAESLAWEVNHSYSQSAGTTLLSSYLGTSVVEDFSRALGASSSGLDYYDKLTEGNFTINIYDSVTGDRIDFSAIDFDPSTPEIDNFDPEVHTMWDLVEGINATFPGQLDASIVDGKLQITARDGYEIAFSNDSTGLLAALGVNTFFSGSDAGDISVNTVITQNSSLINTGSVNEAGIITAGDNSVALDISGLSSEEVKISTVWESSTQSLSSFYSSLVSTVGADASAASFNASYHTTLADTIYAKKQALSGVNLDEEMADLIRFQHSYTASAKLITTADEMLQTIIGLKQ